MIIGVETFLSHSVAVESQIVSHNFQQPKSVLMRASEIDSIAPLFGGEDDFNCEEIPA